MQDFPFKRRVGMFFGLLCLFVPLILGGGLLSLATLKEYFSFPSELSFSSFFCLWLLCCVYLDSCRIFFFMAYSTRAQGFN